MAKQLFAAALILSGIFLISEVFIFPLLRLYLESPTTEIASPQLFVLRPEGKNIVGGGTIPANLWEGTSSGAPKEFSLTIEKLGIERARVFTDVDVSAPANYQEVLRRGLGHVKNTPYPGQWGSTFIIGHSALPFFYNPENYETIFSKLDLLVAGDQILVEFGGKKLSYRVNGTKVVADGKRPENILSGGGYKLILMTCYPPGLTLRRLLVIAELLTN